jgi:plastocyanin
MRAMSLSAVCLLAAACGSSSITNSGGSILDLLDPNQPRDPAPTVSITAAGVAPQVSHLNRGTPVRFVNNDSVNHRLGPAPELRYDNCPELDGLPNLEPGQSASVTIDRNGTVCAFHDDAQPATRALQGVLVVH